MSNTKPCSYSLLKDFETCMRMCYYVNIVKTAKKQFSDNPTQRRGKEFHKVIENAMQFGDERLPKKWAHYQWAHDRAKKFVANMKKRTNNEPVVTAEHKIAIDEDFLTRPFFSTTGFYRGVLDLTVTAYKLAYLADWKAGNPNYADPTQLHDQAILLFQEQPEVERIIAELVFVREEGMIVKRTYTREKTNDPKVDDCLEDMQDDLNVRVMRFRNMDFGSAQEWKPKKNGLCKAHCPVVGCQFNGANEDD